MIAVTLVELALKAWNVAPLVLQYVDDAFRANCWHRSSKFRIVTHATKGTRARDLCCRHRGYLLVHVRLWGNGLGLLVHDGNRYVLLVVVPPSTALSAATVASRLAIHKSFVLSSFSNHMLGMRSWWPLEMYSDEALRRGP